MTGFSSILSNRKTALIQIGSAARFFRSGITSFRAFIGVAIFIPHAFLPSSRLVHLLHCRYEYTFLITTGTRRPSQLQSPPTGFVAELLKLRSLAIEQFAAGMDSDAICDRDSGI